MSSEHEDAASPAPAMDVDSAPPASEADTPNPDTTATNDSEHPGPNEDNDHDDAENDTQNGTQDTPDGADDDAHDDAHDDEDHDEDTPDDDDDDKIDPNDPYPPRAIVLAKVKGYPKWPAMVLSERVLPENIRKIKPKAARRRVIPVRFFSDDTYIWIHDADLATLSPKMIEAHFDEVSRKRRKDNMLEAAYTLALDPPEMELFAQYGSRLAPDPTEELDDEILDMASGDEPRRKAKTKKELAKEAAAERAAQRAADKAAAAENAARNPRKRRALPQATAQPSKSHKKQTPESRELAAQAAAAAAKRQEEALKAAGYDSDWGVDEVFAYDRGFGDYICDSAREQQQLFDKEIGTAAEVAKRYTKFHQKFDRAAEAVLEAVVAMEANPDAPSADTVHQLDPEAAVAALHELSAVIASGVPRSMYAKSRVMRWLVVLARMTPEQLPYPEVKQTIDEVLEATLGFEVPTNTPEMMRGPEIKEESVDVENGDGPKDENGDGPKDENTVDHKDENAVDHSEVGHEANGSAEVKHEQPQTANGN
ncbi:hypothetical protein DICA2_F34332 [Diutina catenulata]